MRLVIDKANLSNVARLANKRLQQDALFTMQTQLDVEFNFTKEERDQEANSDELLGFWFQEFSELKGTHNRHYYVQPGEEPFSLRENTYDTWPKPHTAFLLEQPAELVRQHQLAGELMVYTLGEESRFFTTIFLGSQHRETHRGLSIGKEGFRQWNDLSRYITPLTDLILVDPYIGSSRELLASNLLSIVRLFRTGKRGRTNIILLTDKSKLAAGVTLESLQQSIKAEIASIQGCAAQVTVVGWQGDTKQNRQQHPEIEKFEEHDRTLITNYVRWKTGDTFNYFDSQNKRITRGRSLDMFSMLAKRDYLAEAQDLLNDINNYLLRCQTSNPSNIVGDRSSRLLSIPRA